MENGRRALVVVPMLAVLLGAAAPAERDEPVEENRPSKAHPRVRPKPPPGFVEVFVAGVIPGEQGHTVVLTDAPRERFLPMAIGGTEALSIHLRLERRAFERPLTHDLLEQVLRELGGRVVMVHVHDLKGGTFHGTLFLEAKGKMLAFDARPSDAIALALGNDVPIFVAKRVLEEAGIRPSDIPAEPQPEKAPAPSAGSGSVYEL